MPTSISLLVVQVLSTLKLLSAIGNFSFGTIKITLAEQSKLEAGEDEYFQG